MCLFQDQLGKRIGSAKRHGDLDFFEKDPGTSGQALMSICDFSSMTSEQKIMLGIVG